MNPSELPPMYETSGSDLSVTEELIHAIAEKNSEKVAALLRGHRRANPNQASRQKLMPLHFACFVGSLEIVHLLILDKANILQKDAFDKTPEQYAIFGKNVQILNRLQLEKKQLALELFSAVNKNQEERVKTLLDSGLNPNFKNQKGASVLHLATSNGFYPIVKLLLDHFAIPNCQTDQGVTPLYLAVTKDKIDIFKELITHNVNIQTVYKNKQTILHIAARLGRLEMVKILVERGAKIQAEDVRGLTALDYATLSGNRELQDYLFALNLKNAEQNGVQNPAQGKEMKASLLGKNRRV